MVDFLSVRIAQQSLGRQCRRNVTGVTVEQAAAAPPPNVTQIA
jgi:hypothetical protein